MPSRWRTPAGALVALTLTAAATSCSSGVQGAQPVPPERAGPVATGGSTPSERGGVAPTVPALPVKEGGPLTALPECQPAPQPVQADVPGLVLPDGAVITSVERQHPLTTVRGYIADTPVNVRKYYFQQRDDLDFSELEDELYEAETLYTLGVHNVYVKAQATCMTGSQLIAVVGPSGKNVPLPKVGGGSN